MQGALDTQEYVATCRETGDVCAETARFCLARGGALGERTVITPLVTTAAVARLVADYLVSGAELALPAIDFLEELCTQCGEECERHDEELLQACAERCFWCASCVREALPTQ